jgi:hypothetical protein
MQYPNGFDDFANEIFTIIGGFVVIFAVLTTILLGMGICVCVEP